MGIIQKQSFKSSIYIFIGFLIGAVNILILFPRFFSQGEIGLTRAMIDISLTLSVLCTLGSLPMIYKFFPFYNDYTGPDRNDLPMITAIACTTGFLVTCLAGFFFRDFIIRKLGKSPEFAHYFYTIYPYTFCLLLFSWLEAFGWCLKKTTITNFLRETGVRLLTTLLIVFYAFHWINLQQFIHSFSVLYLIPALVLLVVLIRTRKWKLHILPLSSVTRRLKKKMVVFSLFIFGAQFLNVLARTNDTILVISLRGLADTGIFAIATYVSAALEIPQRSITSISVPVLSESWKNKNMDNIRNIYSKSVSNLLVIGLGLFGLIWLNIHNLVLFLNKLSSGSNGNYEVIGSVVFIMGLAKVLDLATGVNGQIIGTSNYWRFDFYTNVFYTVLSIPLNFVLIKSFGLMGLAYSNLMALTIYNGVRYFFLWKKFGLQPYTITHCYILVCTVLVYLGVYHIPQSSNLYLDIMIRSVAFMALFVPVVHFTRAAPDLSTIIADKLSMFTSKRKMH